jgi:hypothetical protein
MKKIILLTAILFISLVNFAQDTTYTFINDTIPACFVLDSVEQTPFIIRDTLTLGYELKKDYELKGWFIVDTNHINVNKYIVISRQKGFKKYGTNQVIRFYRTGRQLYVRQPQKIKIRVVSE